MSPATTSKGRTRGVAVMIVSILLIVGAAVYIGLVRSSSSKDFEGTGDGVEQIVEIPEGSTLTAMGRSWSGSGSLARIRRSKMQRWPIRTLTTFSPAFTASKAR